MNSQMQEIINMIKIKFEELLVQYQAHYSNLLDEFMAETEKTQKFLFKNEYIKIEYQYNELKEKFEEKQPDYKTILQKLSRVEANIQIYRDKNLDFFKKIQEL